MDSKITSSDRPLTRGMQIMLLTASVLVFLVGIPLLFFTGQTDRFFAWTIGSQLTAAFLGGAYWSSGVLEFMASREKWWANARIAVPAVFLFTVLTFIVTLIHIGNFHFDATAWQTLTVTWGWLIVYTVVPLIMGGLLIRQGLLTGDDPARRRPLPSWTRGLLGLHAAIMLPMGIALLLFPLATASIWPWDLTALTGRAIGAWLTSIGVIAVHAVFENDWSRLRGFTVTYGLFAVLQLLALLRFGNEVEWGTAAAWVYLLVLLSIGVVGAAGTVQGRAAR
ncbi:MAG: hypothetical protein ACLFWD_03450 [Anaerolineales bacterium]